MNYLQTKQYCLTKPEAHEDYPFGPDALVFKINDKLFAILGEEKGVARVNLKCDPDEALMLRDIFDAVIPGYHMNKRHWNTVILDGSIPQGEIERMIDRSYGLVVKSLKKAERKSLELAYGEEQLYR
ncbi:MmcQ/YjbR family DNA-binding protein [Eionea flava]